MPETYGALGEQLEERRSYAGGTAPSREAGGAALSAGVATLAEELVVAIGEVAGLELLVACAGDRNRSVRKRRVRNA